MTKKYFIALITTLIISIGTTFANTTTIEQIQSPIYTDDIGRSHFLGKGGYSSVRHVDMGGAYNNVVNDAINTHTKKNEIEYKNIQETTNKIEETKDIDITKVIKENNEIPISSSAKATFSAEQSKMDASSPFGKGATFLPSSGVNESKTMYTDEIGRLHFFGKANKFKD
jgi:hypothetical protein